MQPPRHDHQVDKAHTKVFEKLVSRGLAVGSRQSNDALYRADAIACPSSFPPGLRMRQRYRRRRYGRRPRARRASAPMRRPVRRIAAKPRSSVRTNRPSPLAMGTSNENDQADRAISTGKLHTLLRFHTRPINVVVFHDSQGILVSRSVSRLDAFSGYPFRI